MANNVKENLEWKTVKIKDFGVVSTGNTPSTRIKDFYNGIYKLISPADLTDSKFITTAHKLITEKGLKVSRTLPRNAVLVGCIGNVGKIGMTTDELSAFNQQINAIVCNEKFDPDFVYYLLRYKRPLFESKSAKVTLPILNKTNFENIELESPELPEQKAIANVLNTAQDAISGQKALIEKLKKLKKSMMHHLFTHGTKNEPTKMTEIGEIPESWKITELQGICDIIMGQSPSSKTYNRENDGMIFHQGKTDFGEKYPKARIYCNRPIKIANSNDILISVRAPVGPVNITKLQCCIGRGLAALRSKEKLNQTFLYFIMIFNEEKISSLGTGSTFHAINKTQLGQFEIPLPAVLEQEKIAKVLSLIDQKIESAQAKLLAYQKLFKTLLHELMSGERRVV